MILNINSLICWHNGTYKKINEVNISIFDFGFIHCDATYDVLRSQDGKLMHYKLHHERFLNSCNYFELNPIEDVKSIAHNLLKKNNLKDAFVWMCAWRGAPLSGSPRDLSGKQHSLIYVKPYYPLKFDSEFRLIIHQKHRRVPDVCYNQSYKNFGWIEFTQAQREANNQGVDSALLLTVDGFISEGPGFGVCFINNNSVITPQKDCLDSITIKLVEKVCHKHNIPFIRKNITPAEAYNSQEAFVCSTSGGITLVKSIDHAQYNTHTISNNIQLWLNNHS